MSPPGNRLEALHGDLKGRRSIRVNDQWRVVFRWVSGDAHDVRVTDYQGYEWTHDIESPSPPGEVLQEEFMSPLGVTQVALAEHIGVSVQRIHEIVRGKRGITPETAWLLAQAFGRTPEFWVNLQVN